MSNRVVIGYLSGSNTHDKDFKVVESVLLRILKDFPEAELLTVGPITVSQEFNRFKDRYHAKPLVSYEEFQNVFNLIDINIVPLEVDEEFCQAKSELKFIEAGAYGVPSVCSATQPHLEIIEHGINGYLAKNDSDWYSSLVDLMLPIKRKQAGENAKQTVVLRYRPEVRASEWGIFIKSLSIKKQGCQFSNTELFFMKFQFYKFYSKIYNYSKILERTIRLSIKNYRRARNQQP